MGRPPVQHHKHIISFDDGAVELLTEMKDAYLQGRVIEAVGEAAEGFLSNPAGALWAAGGIIAALAVIVGKDKLDSILDYFASLQTLLQAETGEEKSTAANQLAIDLRALIRALSPLGPLTPLP